MTHIYRLGSLCDVRKLYLTIVQSINNLQLKHTKSTIEHTHTHPFPFRSK